MAFQPPEEFSKASFGIRDANGAIPPEWNSMNLPSEGANPKHLIDTDSPWLWTRRVLPLPGGGFFDFGEW